MSDEFTNLKRKITAFREHPQRWQTREGMIDLICLDCPFWKEDEKEGYECGGFRLLKRMLEKKMISTEAILEAVEG